MGKYETFMSWVSSPAGKAMANKIAAGLACGAFSWHLAVNTVFLQRIRDVVQMHRKGFPVPLSEELTSKANEVLKQCNLPIREKNLITFFVPFGMEMFSAGNTSTRWGAHIGIPHNFNYKTKADAELSTLQLQQDNFSFETPAGQEIVESLILSENAKHFAIARDIYMSATNFTYVKCVLSGVCLYGSYAFGAGINKRYRIQNAPLYLRALLYLAIGAMGVGCYVTIKDAFCHYYEVNSDLRAAEMGKDYVKGGIEMYEKMLRRNKALYTALGESGPKMYTAHGNVHTWIRTKHVPLSVRHDILKAYEKKEDSSKHEK